MIAGFNRIIGGAFAVAALVLTAAFVPAVRAASVELQIQFQGPEGREVFLKSGEADVFAIRGGVHVAAVRMPGARGRFALALPEAGDWLVGGSVSEEFGFVLRDGRINARASVVDTKRVVLVIALQRIAGLITGTLVKPDGSPASEAFVNVSGGSSRGSVGAATNGFGSFHLFVPSGAFTASAYSSAADGDLINPEIQPITIAPDRQFANVALLFKRSDRTISGTLIGPGGVPVRGTVYARSNVNGYQVSAETGAAGNFSLKLKSGDVWTVTAVGWGADGTPLESGPVQVNVDFVNMRRDFALVPANGVAPALVAARGIPTGARTTVALSDGAAVYFPENAVSASAESGVTVNMSRSQAFFPRNSRVQALSPVYSVGVSRNDGRAVAALARPAVIEIPYDPDLVRAAGARENNLSLAYVPKNWSGAVLFLNAVVDTVRHVVAAPFDRANLLAGVIVADPAKSEDQNRQAEQSSGSGTPEGSGSSGTVSATGSSGNQVSTIGGGSTGPDYSINVPTNQVTVVEGQVAAIPVTLNQISGSPISVQFIVSGSPGVSANISPSACTPTCSTILSASAGVGTHTITIDVSPPGISTAERTIIDFIVESDVSSLGGNPTLGGEVINVEQPGSGGGNTGSGNTGGGSGGTGSTGGGGGSGEGGSFFEEIEELSPAPPIGPATEGNSIVPGAGPESRPQAASLTLVTGVRVNQVEGEIIVGTNRAATSEITCTAPGNFKFMGAESDPVTIGRMILAGSGAGKNFENLPAGTSVSCVLMVRTTEDKTEQVQFSFVVGARSGAVAIPAFSRNLGIGSRDTATQKDVTALQNFLKERGHFTVTPTGFFGPVTAVALKKFQEANGISPASGYLGPLTRKFIAEQFTAAPPVQPPQSQATPQAGAEHQTALQAIQARIEELLRGVQDLLRRRGR